MKIHLPTSAYLGNIDRFIRGYDPSFPEKLNVTFDQRWVTVHPVVLAMVGALGLKVGVKNINVGSFNATSINYFKRMGLFKMLGDETKGDISQHESSGRFVPLTQIKSAEGQTRFITELTPLLRWRAG
jgi:hypothetical protein